MNGEMTLEMLTGNWTLTKLSSRGNVGKSNFCTLRTEA